MQSYQFIIVGAGMAGAALAHELSQVATVCLVESEERPGYHSTGRSAALYAPAYGGATIRALTRASRELYDAPPPQFGAYPLLSPRGCLFIARRDQRQSAERMLDDLRGTVPEIRVASREDTFGQVPLLRESYVDSAVFDPTAMDIDVDSLHQGYLRGARARGARLLTGSPASNVRRERGRWLVALATETVTAPVLINAAGAWADALAEQCGARPLGLQPLRRTAALVDLPDPKSMRRWPAVIDVDEQFYFKPEAGKLLISPADETPVAAADVQPDEFDVATGIDRVEAALAIDVRHVTRSWAGLRTFSPDRVPVVGYDSALEGFFWCAGQGGYGIQTAPALSRVAAALALGNELPADVRDEGVVPAHLSPARFGAV